MPLPQITAIGNIATNPELRFTAQGIPLLEFRLASNESKKDKDGKWVDGRSTFLKVTLWRSAAEQAAQELKTGDHVIVAGKLVIEDYTDKEGNARQSVGIDVDTIGLAYGKRKDATTTRSQKPAISDEEPF